MSDSASSVGARLMAGRKRDSTVWKFFEYDASTDKSECMVQSEGKQCSAKLSGNNSSNMAAHLQRRHKEAFAEFEEIDKAKAYTTGQHDQTLQDCIQRKGTYWSQDLTEHNNRQLSIMNKQSFAFIEPSSFPRDDSYS